METLIQPAEQKSFILIEFVSVGSVMLRLVPQNVTPLQMLAVAQYLEVLGKAALMEQEHERREQEAHGKIAKPEPGIIVPNR